MPIQNAIRNIEIRKDCMIIHLDDGNELKIREEDVITSKGNKVMACVVRYKNQIIWSSQDHK